MFLSRQDACTGADGARIAGRRVRVSHALPRNKGRWRPAQAGTDLTDMRTRPDHNSLYPLTDSSCTVSRAEK